LCEIGSARSRAPGRARRKRSWKITSRRPIRRNRIRRSSGASWSGKAASRRLCACRPAPTTFRLELPDGRPAEPPAFKTIELNWKPGDTIFVEAGRNLRVVPTRPVGDDDERVLVVEPATAGFPPGSLDEPGLR
jgi:hypothetical protein